MPNLANITIKKANGTTDIVWTGLRRSGQGPKAPAVWRSDTVSAIPGNRPTFKLSDRPNKDGSTSVMEYQYDYPILATVNGVEVVVSHQRASGVIPVLQVADVTQVNEAVNQFLNLMASALVRACVVEGSSAN